MASKKWFLKSFFLSRNIVTSIEIEIIFFRYGHATKLVFAFFSKDQFLLLWPKQIVAWQLAEKLISFWRTFQHKLLAYIKEGVP